MNEKSAPTERPATPSPDRLWRWFARIHQLKTGENLLNPTGPPPDDNYIETLFDYWRSGYQCRVLDEESNRSKEGVLTP